MSIEDRLYDCFKKIFDEYNGKLSVSLNNSSLVYDLSGLTCSDEFLDEMYKRWLDEGNIDKKVN